MRIGLLAILLALLSSGNAAEESPMKPDGRMWSNYGSASEQSTFLKAAYVQGATEGLRVGAMAGYMAGRSDEKNDALNYIKECVEKGPCATVPIAKMIRPESNNSWGEVLAGASEVRAKFVARHSSVLDIVHQMDKFYSDDKNTPVCMIQALQESVSSLDGKALTEPELEKMREAVCNP